MKNINYELASAYFPEDVLEDIDFFREIALDIDQNPALMNQYLFHPSIAKLCFDRDKTCYQRAQLVEALSYGDPGVLLASPGPSLAGIILRELGNDAQKSFFFDYIEQQRAVSFLAVSEPGKGSDASNMETVISKDDAGHYSLTGEKWFIGHGSDANIGVVICRSSKGPLGITAVLITPEIIKQYDNSHYLHREPMDVLGLHGARVSYLKFNELPIPKSCILGQHLRPMQRGMMAVMRTFNQMRPSIAAFAIGTAQAIVDFLKVNVTLSVLASSAEIDALKGEIDSARQLLYTSAKKIDQNPMQSAFASVAKAKATKVVEKCINYAIRTIGPELPITYPLLMKWCRDGYGYEYMEGTTHMQLMNVYQGFASNLFEDNMTEKLITSKEAQYV